MQKRKAARALGASRLHTIDSRGMLFQGALRGGGRESGQIVQEIKEKNHDCPLIKKKGEFVERKEITIEERPPYGASMCGGGVPEDLVQTDLESLEGGV